MANELPYFRFTVQAWQNGKISIESFELKGFFIDVCGYYWINDCDITLTTLKKKFSNATNLLTELIELGIIKHENRHDKVEIEFLNIQYDLLSEKRKHRQAAGSKGGNAKAKRKQKDSYKDKDNNKDKDKDNNNQSLVFPYDSELFKSTWETVMKSKKWAKKPSTALQASLKKLAKYPEQVAIQMMEETIAGDWQGFFELKQHKQTLTGNKHLDTLSEGAAAIREALGGG